MVANIKQYFQQVSQELKKVSWPTKNELLNSTLVVLVSVTLLAVYVWIADIILSNVMKLIIR